MSLGLGDLKKKQKTTTAAHVVKSEDVESTPVAKPWSTEDLQATRPRGSRKKPEVSDLAMNDETNLQAAPLFFMELASDSRLAKVEDVLVKIEERVVRALDRPLKAAQAFLPKFFAQ